MSPTQRYAFQNGSNNIDPFSEGYIQASTYTYSMNTKGQNLHKDGRSIVIIVTDAVNINHKNQAIGRIKRLGQKKTVILIKITVTGTSNYDATHNVFKKALPQIITELDVRRFHPEDTENIGDREEEDGEAPAPACHEFALGKWIFHPELRLIPDSHPQSGGQEFLQPEQVVYWLLASARGERIIF